MATSSQTEPDVVEFNLERVHDLFLSSLAENNDVTLYEYLNGYKELNQFFHLMGAMFGFVSSDLQQKISILRERLFGDTENACDEGDKPEELMFYRSVEEMMSYEKNNSLIGKKSFISSSRTLLRLHRGLDFIRVFLRDVGELQAGEKTAAICQKAYNDTLAQHHPWIIRTTATVAMYTMPNKEQLFLKVCGSEENITKTLAILPKMLKVTNEVYTRTQALFEKYELQNLD